MPDHWQYVLRPNHDGRLTEFLRWLTHTHTMLWHAHFHSTGSGHLYQGRFKAFPVEDDDHFHAVTRYVERKPLRARFVRKTENWRWSRPERARRRPGAITAGPLASALAARLAGAGQRPADRR